MSYDLKQDFSPFMPHSRGVSRSFTLLELLIVIGIIAVLGSVTFIALNPVETLRKTRDAQRVSELDTLDKVVRMYEGDAASISEGTAGVVYVSLPDTSSTCASWSLPPLPPGQSYHCVTQANLYKTDGNGWLPVNLASISYGAPIQKLPVDPTNNATYYYTFMSGGSFMFSSLLESQSHDAAVTDGGRMPGVYEKGSDLTLGPFTRDQGLVGYWTFDEGSGTTAYDYSGKGNNGTLVSSPTWQTSTNCKVGGCLSFDGTTKYVDVPSLTWQPNSFSISFWIQPLVNSSWNQQIGATQGWGAFNFHTDVSNNIFVGTDIGTRFVLSNSLATNAWQFFTFTFSNGNASIYKNAVLLSSETNMTNPNAWQGFRLSNSINGSIDDVRIYNRALSAQEIQAIYNATR